MVNKKLKEKEEEEGRGGRGRRQGEKEAQGYRHMLEQQGRTVISSPSNFYFVPKVSIEHYIMTLEKKKKPSVE